MNVLTVDEALCTRCGACVQECPISVLVMEGAAAPRFVSERAHRCASCAHCASFCPTGALKIRESRQQTCKVEP